MLKLKYLFDNRELAIMILKNWEFDNSSLNLLDYYRISSNAVYPFKLNDMTYFLRFAPTSEKNYDNIMGEHQFISFLADNNYPVLKYKASLNKLYVVTVSTPWGDYYASVFDCVPGKSLEDIPFTNEISKLYGKHLGRLHKLSSQYTPKNNKRWSYEEVLNWIEEELSKFENEVLSKTEFKLLKDRLSKLTKSSNTFGLIHFDFDMDNVFYDIETNSMSVIDFDDAMYSWFVMDIEQALYSISNEVNDKSFPELKTQFLNGYREEFDVSDETLLLIPLFRRFFNLYSYTRLLHTTAESWANEPTWMLQLRSKLKNAMAYKSKEFGQPIIL